MRMQNTKQNPDIRNKNDNFWFTSSQTLHFILFFQSSWYLAFIMLRQQHTNITFFDFLIHLEIVYEMRSRLEHPSGTDLQLQEGQLLRTLRCEDPNRP